MTEKSILKSKKSGLLLESKLRAKAWSVSAKLGQIPPGRIELRFHALDIVLGIFRDIIAHDGQCAKTMLWISRRHLSESRFKVLNTGAVIASNCNQYCRRPQILDLDCRTSNAR